MKREGADVVKDNNGSVHWYDLNWNDFNVAAQKTDDNNIGSYAIECIIVLDRVKYAVMVFVIEALCKMESTEYGVVWRLKPYKCIMKSQWVVATMVCNKTTYM